MRVLIYAPENGGLEEVYQDWLRENAVELGRKSRADLKNWLETWGFYAIDVPRIGWIFRESL